MEGDKEPEQNPAIKDEKKSDEEVAFEQPKDGEEMG